MVQPTVGVWVLAYLVRGAQKTVWCGIIHSRSWPPTSYDVGFSWYTSEASFWLKIVAADFSGHLPVSLDSQISLAIGWRDGPRNRKLQWNSVHFFSDWKCGMLECPHGLPFLSRVRCYPFSFISAKIRHLRQFRELDFQWFIPTCMHTIEVCTDLPVRTELNVERLACRCRCQKCTHAFRKYQLGLLYARKHTLCTTVSWGIQVHLIQSLPGKNKTRLWAIPVLHHTHRRGETLN